MFRILLFALLFSFTGATVAAEALERCNKFPWACYGVLEVQGVLPDVQKPRLRALRFHDGDIAFEIEEKGAITKKLHIFRVNHAEFYFGVESSMATSPQSNPFAFVDMGLGIPLMVLQKAFPSGYSSVPDGMSQKRVDVPVESKDDSFTLKTEKVASKQVRYWIKSNKSKVPELVGLWDAEVLPALPDDFPLSDWVHAGDTGVKDAKLARLLNRTKK